MSGLDSNAQEVVAEEKPEKGTFENGANGKSQKQDPVPKRRRVNKGMS